MAIKRAGKRLIKTDKHKIHLKIVAVGVVGTPKERRWRNTCVLFALVDLLTLSHSIRFQPRTTREEEGASLLMFAIHARQKSRSVDIPLNVSQSSPEIPRVSTRVFRVFLAGDQTTNLWCNSSA